MTGTLNFGKITHAGDWTLIPIIRKISFQTPTSGFFSIFPVGIIGIREEDIHFFPLCRDLIWKDIEKELLP